jgi:hypothetical protein
MWTEEITKFLTENGILLEDLDPYELLEICHNQELATNLYRLAVYSRLSGILFIKRDEYPFISLRITETHFFFYVGGEEGRTLKYICKWEDLFSIWVPPEAPVVFWTFGKLSTDFPSLR